MNRKNKILLIVAVIVVIVVGIYIYRLIYPNEPPQVEITNQALEAAKRENAGMKRRLDELEKQVKQGAKQIRQEELGLANQLMRQGRNPHEYAYKLAAARGYQRKAAPPPIPEVPKPTQLAPDQTLGTSGGSDAPEAEQPDEFTRAFTEVFKRRA